MTKRPDFSVAMQPSSSTNVVKNHGVLRFNSRDAPSHWAVLDPDVGMHRVQRLLFEEWRLQQPGSLICIEGGAGIHECCVLPAHEELALAHGLVSAARISNAWVIGGALDEGATQLVGRVLRSSAGVVSLGVAPWTSVAQREQVAELADRRIFTYDALRLPDDADDYDGVPASTGGGQPLSDGASHLLLTDGGSPEKSQPAHAKAFRAALEAYLSSQTPSLSTDTAAEALESASRLPPACCPRLMLVLGGGLATLNAVLGALKAGWPVVVLPSSGFAAADIFEMCTGASKMAQGTLHAPLPRALSDMVQRPDEAYRKDGPGLLRSIAQLARTVRIGPHRQRALRFFRPGGGADATGLSEMLLHALLGAAGKPLEALATALDWRHAPTLGWLLRQPGVAVDAPSFGAALERALLLRHVPSVAAMLQAHAPMHLVRLDTLCDDERFKRAVATTAGARYMQPSESSRMRQDGELDLSRSRSRDDEQSRPALCPGSAWGFALLRSVLEETREEYGSLLRMRWRAALVAEADGTMEPSGCDGQGARLLPSSLELLIWAVLCGEPSLARALWERSEDPLRTAILASVVARSVARSAGAATFSFAVAQGLARDATTYESWAISLLEHATDAEAHVLLLSTDAEYLGQQRSALELASDMRRACCRALCTHPKVAETLEKLADGFIAPVPASVLRQPAGMPPGCIPSPAATELHRLARPAVTPADVRIWCETIDAASALRLGGVAFALDLYADAQPPSAFGALVHPARVPKVKHAVHMLSSLAYLLLLGLALCALPITNDPERPAMALAAGGARVPDPHNLGYSEMVVWVWTATLLLEQLKHAIRVGFDAYERKGTSAALLSYLDDGAHLREAVCHLVLLLAAALRIGVRLDVLNVDAMLLRWVQTLYALVVLLATTRFVGELQCSSRAVGVYACTLQQMLYEVATWLLVVALLLAATGVALTVLLPGPSGHGHVWDKPGILPLLSLLGAFDLEALEATLLDPTVVGATPVWRYPTDYLPPLLLLVAQLLLFIFLLSALIATLAGRYAALAAAGEEAWCLGRFRFVCEYKDERDALPPPLNAFVLFCHDLPKWGAKAARGGFDRSRVVPGTKSDRIGAQPRPVLGLKLKCTLPHATIDALQHLARDCRDRAAAGASTALLVARDAFASAAAASAYSSSASSSASSSSASSSMATLQIACLAGRLEHLETEYKQNERLLRAVLGSEPEELLALRSGVDPERQATRHALHALHQASSARLPAPPSKRIVGLQSRVERLPTLQVGPAKSAPTQVVFGSSLMPVHRVGPRLPGTAPAAGAQPPTVDETVDEQLGHLITPEIYRAFCLYGDKSLSGISVEDGGEQLRAAVAHVVPRLKMGAAAEGLLQRCVYAGRESKMRVGLHALGKLIRDLSAQNARSDAQGDGAGGSSSSRPSASGGRSKTVLPVPELGPEATLRAQTVFRRHERAGSGTLDASDLRHALLELGLPATFGQIAIVIQRYERNAKERIDADEFLELTLELYLFHELARRAERSFNAHDRDADGSLDVAEVKRALLELGLEVSTSAHVLNVLHRYETLERDGKLDLREFLVLVRDLYNFQRLVIRAERCFQLHDANADGLLDALELQAALLQLGIDTNAARTRARDGDGDFKLDQREYLELVRDLHHFRAASLPTPTDDVSRTFARFDRDLGGHINVLELRVALTELGLTVDTEEALRVLRRFDANRSGQLELAEFRHLVGTLQSYQQATLSNPASSPSEAVAAALARAVAAGDVSGAAAGEEGATTDEPAPKGEGAAEDAPTEA